ncbi:NAD(P)H-hydrate dehydratase [Alkalihalobacillus sp. CinArs1]|uniref:NAD(P)H-hydrate dehydratase n=1 Tax=Alkalihalobacillus sp. CinArs1 TaxID=2995314 RepID=UPI0022DD023E|nr:NAD(P)H-hydrate dehydratase [Alkalihalobacillus sp. CinArs1]
MRIVSGKEMYEADRFAMEEIGLSGAMLMENAGRALFEAMKEELKGQRIAVVIGTGNNGGDGFVLSRYLKEHDYDVDVWVVPSLEKLRGDAKTHFTIFQRSGFEWKALNQGNEWLSHLDRYTVLIDCLLGLGLSGPIRTPYKELIQRMNESGISIYSVDLPSGLRSDGGYEGEVEPIRADRTYTLEAPKTGAFLHPDADYYGELEVLHIGLPRKAFEKAQSKKIWTDRDVASTLSDRAASSHKGSHGKGLVIGGSSGMAGAPIMTAKAAYRSGAGLIHVAVPEEILSVTAGALIEAMFQGWPSEGGHFNGTIPEALSFDGIAAGPGLGREKGGRKLVQTLMEEDCLLVLDADALFHLSGLKDQLLQRQAPTILTPHPGEMARLADCSIADVQRNRFELSYRFAREYGVYLVLKGPYTLVTDPNGNQFVNPTGNPALAKGGSGDVLTGMVLSFVMHSNSIQEGISNAVYLHGKAADMLVQSAHSTLDVLATDVIEQIPAVLHSFLKHHYG